MNTGDPPYKRWLDTTKEEYPSHVQGGRLERFVAAVESNPAFRAIYEAAAANEGDQEAKSFDEVDSSAPIVSSSPIVSVSSAEHSGGPEAELLLQAARSGACLFLASHCRPYVNKTDQSGVTALHVAAECGNFEDVKFLFDVGAVAKRDNQGLTPLHFVASSTEPNPKIAKLLIEKANTIKNEIIRGDNVDESTRGNTALHFAADNEHTSRKFIQTLESIDPSIKNNNGETAFHIAARAENPDVIVSMLEVFTPAKTGWEMTSIETETEETLRQDQKTKTGPTLLEICAKRGNAKAVALLIKYGANISEKILFHLIDESVANPTMTDKLVGVYRTITENCVLWDWLKHRSVRNQERYPRRGTEPEAYGKEKRKIMLRLLTERKKLSNHGDRNVLEYAIIKGDKVFLNEIVNTPGVFKITDKSHNVKYDITDFVTSDYGGPVLQKLRRLTARSRVQPVEEADVGDVVPRSPPKRSYLHLITANRHLWENTDILHLEPFLTITQPMCSYVQFIYFVMAVIQLTHMICFSAFYMPSFCRLQYQLNLNNLLTECNLSTIPPEPFVVVNVPLSYAITNFLWLLWPTALFFGTLYFRCHCTCRLLGQILRGCLSARLLLAPILWGWYVTTFICHKLYLPLTSVIFLIGWIVTLSFFINALEDASIFSFLLKDIILKDILINFGIVFSFVLLSFSSAIHLLREKALLGHTDYFDTLYNVFASALTTGDFMKETFGNDVVRIRLLQTMFAIYLCCATIILLNILITMMNNRYDEARKKAKNVWRFHTVHSWLQFGFNQVETLGSFRFYWKFVSLRRKFWKHVNTAYDEVSIDDGDPVFLHLITQNTYAEIN